MNNIEAVCEQVRQTAYAIHVYHAQGHLEKVYENALAHRLRKLGLEVKQQHPIQVFDEDGTLLGDYLADLLGRQPGQRAAHITGTVGAGQAG